MYSINKNNYLCIVLTIQIYKIMLKVFLYCVLIIAICVAFMSVRVIFKKNGRFVKSHVSSSKAMRERGITCAQSQDFAQRHRKKAVKEF